MLKAEGSYILPDNVPANEFLNLEGNKLSTSKNWAVWLHEYLEDFPGKQDALRYTLTATAPETKDNDFTWKDFQSRNKELADNYGNFINRILVLTNKYYDGVIPTPGEFLAADLDALEELKKFPADIAFSLERYRFREANFKMMNLARLGNKYLAEQEPWKEIKVDEERTKTMMYVGLQIATALATLSEPFIPFASKTLQELLQQPSTNWFDIAERTDLLPAGHKIKEGKAPILFPQIEDEDIQKQLDRLENIKQENEKANKKAAPQKEISSFEDFSKLDLRVGTIVEAEKMPKTKKLLVLKVDTGIDVRTVVSGIAESFKPEDVIGKKVTILVNLAPRKLRGVESEGMILMTENSAGKVVFVNPDEDDIMNGEGIA